MFHRFFKKMLRPLGIALTLVLGVGPLAQPAFASGTIPASTPPAIQASIKTGDATQGGQGTYTFNLKILQGSTIPQSLKVVVPQGYSKTLNQSPNVAGTLAVTYNGKSASGNVYGGASQTSVQLIDTASNTYDYGYSFSEQLPSVSSAGSLTVTANSTGTRVMATTAASDLVITLRLNQGQITNPSNQGVYTWLVEDGSGNVLTAVATVVGNPTGLTAGSSYALTITNNATGNSSSQAFTSPGYTFGMTASQGSTVPQSLTVQYPSGYTPVLPVDSTTPLGSLWVSYNNKTGTGTVYKNKSVALAVPNLGTLDYGYAVQKSGNSMTISAQNSSGLNVVPTTALASDMIIGLVLNPGIVQTNGSVNGQQFWNVTDGNNNTIFSNVPTTIASNIALTADGSTYGPSTGTLNVNGDLTVSSGSANSISLQNLNGIGTLTLNPGASGTVNLTNVQAQAIIILSGAANSIYLTNTTASTLTVNAPNQATPVNVVLQGATVFGGTTVRSGVTLNAQGTNSQALGSVSISVPSTSSTASVTLGGTISSPVTVLQGGSPVTLAIAPNAQLTGNITAQSPLTLNLGTSASVTGTISAQSNVTLYVPSGATVSAVQVAAPNVTVGVSGSGTVSNVSVTSGISGVILNVAADAAVATVQTAANITVQGAGTIGTVSTSPGISGVTVTVGQGTTVNSSTGVTLTPASSGGSSGGGSSGGGSSGGGSSGGGSFGGGGTIPSGGGTTPGTSGTITMGGDNTQYNQGALQALSSLTAAQKAMAELPASTPVVTPNASASVTLTAADGLKITIPSVAVAGVSAPMQITVEVGSITTPPKANAAVVVLNPVKYQRTFGVSGQADGTVRFAAPVTLTFPIAVSDLPTGVTTPELAVYRWDATRGDWMRLGGVYDAIAGTLSVPTYHFSTYAVMADTAVVPTRLSGTDRFSTANAVADQGWAAGANSVVIANAYAFPDALAASPLAFKYNAPILLTDNGSLTPSTWTEIQKLKPTHVYIVGGTGVVSQAIQDSLGASYGAENVVRYAGQDRYGTAAAIATALGTTGKAVIASGEDGHYPDALAISSYAAYNGIPILFTEENNLPVATTQVLSSQKVTTTYVAGGEGAVGAAVFAQLPGATRYSGADRYATAVSIATGLNLNVSHLYPVTGLDFPDALVSGNLAAHTLSPIIMVDNGVPSSTLDFLTAYKSSIVNLTDIGGTGVITPDQDAQLRAALQ